MDIATVDFIEAVVNRIGLSMAISVFAIWIVSDIYLTIKKKIVKHLEKQTDTGAAIAKVSSDTMKILETMYGEQKTHWVETHDYMLEARIKRLREPDTEGEPR